MTATEELRRMLDERGIEYSMREDSWAKETYWIVNHNPYRFSERSEYGTCVLHIITPEQAVTATLSGRTCRDKGGIGTKFPATFICSECGWYSAVFSFGEGEPCYCPNCGRKVER